MLLQAKASLFVVSLDLKTNWFKAQLNLRVTNQSILQKIQPYDYFRYYAGEERELNIVVDLFPKFTPTTTFPRIFVLCFYLQEPRSHKTQLLFGGP